MDIRGMNDDIHHETRRVDQDAPLATLIFLPRRSPKDHAKILFERPAQSASR
jgi:hypothetical protein